VVADSEKKDVRSVLAYVHSNTTPVPAHYAHGAHSAALTVPPSSEKSTQEHQPSAARSQRAGPAVYQGRTLQLGLRALLLDDHAAVALSLHSLQRAKLGHRQRLQLVLLVQLHRVPRLPRARVGLEPRRQRLQLRGGTA